MKNPLDIMPLISNKEITGATFSATDVIVLNASGKIRAYESAIRIK